MATPTPRRKKAEKQPPQTSAPDARRLWTRHELATELGQHPQTLVKWERDGMPIAVRGARGVPSTYRLADVWRWTIDRARGQAGVAERSLGVERAKLAEAQRMEAVLRIRKRQGELLERADVEKTWLRHINDARALLLALPRAHADRVARVAKVDGTAGVEKALHEAITDALRGLAGGGN